MKYCCIWLIVIKGKYGCIMRYCKGFKRNLSEMFFIEKKQNMFIVYCNIVM